MPTRLPLLRTAGPRDCKPGARGDSVMIRRPATTLVEVLVAIFVMGIGLLALLTLFPLGALSMAQAIKDDRAGLAADDATSAAKAHQLHLDAAVLTAEVTPGGGRPSLANRPNQAG